MQKTTALGEYNTKRAESNNNNRWMQQHKEQKQWNEDIESNATMFVKKQQDGKYHNTRNQCETLSDKHKSLLI